MSSNKTFAPSFTAARMFRKMSANGVEYFAGRMGGVRLTLFRSREPSVDGDEVWELRFAEAPPRQATSSDAVPTQRAPQRKRQAQDDADAPF